MAAFPPRHTTDVGGVILEAVMCPVKRAVEVVTLVTLVPIGVKRHLVLRSKATPSFAHLRIVLFSGRSASYDPVAAFSDT